jgi:biotin carboxyl carrier protein
MRYFITVDESSHEVEIGGEGPFRVIHSEGDSEPIHSEVHGSNGSYRVYLNGKVFDLLLDGTGSNLRVEVNGRRIPIAIRSERDGDKAAKKKSAAGTSRAVAAQMPGRVLHVRVKDGERIAAGSPLVVIEAMKMENELVADADATVERVLVQPGDAVEAGAPLLILS